jgi:prephenate dehydrogenase
MPNRITIIGTGLIGGSLGLALKKAKLGFEIVGHDRRIEVANKAKQRGAVDKAEWNLPAALDGASLVILAIPVMAIKPTLETIAQNAKYLQPDCIVTDTASTKVQVLAWAEAILPRGVNFVGGHPMAGKEAGGIEEAAAELFQGSTYCLLPAHGAAAQAVETMIGLANAVGAKPYFLDPAEHDAFVAAVEHLPFILSSALVSTITQDISWREMRRLASASFREVSSLAAGDAEDYAATCAANQGGILRWIDTYIADLQEWRALVAAGGEPLKAAFDAAYTARERWLRGLDEEQAPGMPVPGVGDQMRQMLLGRLGQPREPKKS